MLKTPMNPPRFGPVLLGVALASRALLAQPGGWETHGPPFPDVRALAVSPDDDGVVFAGTSDPAS